MQTVVMFQSQQHSLMLVAFAVDNDDAFMDAFMVVVWIGVGMDYFANRCYVPVTAAQSYAGSFCG